MFGAENDALCWIETTHAIIMKLLLAAPTFFLFTDALLNWRELTQLSLFVAISYRLETAGWAIR